MSEPTSRLALGWRPLDRVAFGLIYGAILMLSLLMAAGEFPRAQVKTAAMLFGSILAVTLARTFADLVAHAIATGERMLTPRALAAAWNGSYPTLAVAVLPTALYLAAAFGWCSATMATTLSQVFCVAILVVFGARVGWVVRGKWWLSLFGAVTAGGIGVTLAAMNYALQ